MLEVAALLTDSALERAPAVAAAKACIAQLQRVKWSYTLLEQSGVVGVVKAARDKCKDAEVAASAKAMVKAWKKAFKK